MPPIIIESIPGDKSISHRAIIIGSLTQGASLFNGFLCSDDCLNTLTIFQQLGVAINLTGTTVKINSAGVAGLKSPNSPLDVGNSGTGIRLIAGALTGSNITATLTGDASIQKRPMGRIIDPLTLMGANIIATDNRPPLQVTGTPNLIPNTSYKMPIASAQVKSALLLAGCAANIPVKVIEPEQCRDHTERMLRLFGAKIESKNGTVSLTDAGLISPASPIQIPADISSALFFICLALMSNRDVIFKNIGLNKSRIGCLEALKMMNADINILEHENNYEPMGDIHVKPSNQRKNVTIPLALVPNLIDELPILAMLALTQPGKFLVRGAAELRVKESDRIAGICRLVKALGGQVIEYDDGFEVSGPIANPAPFEFDAHFDHRLAMSAMIMSKQFKIAANVIGTDSIPTSFPNFNELMAQFL